MVALGSGFRKFQLEELTVPESLVEGDGQPFWCKGIKRGSGWGHNKRRKGLQVFVHSPMLHYILIVLLS